VKIALLGPAPPMRGGIAAHSRGLLRELESNGHDTLLVSWRRPYPPGARGYQLIDENPSALLDVLNPVAWRRAARQLVEQAPDVLVVQWWHPVTAPCLAWVLASCRGAGLDAPVLVICHNHTPHEYFPGSRSLTRLLLGRADGLLAHSRWVASELGRSYPRAALRSCPMPVLEDYSLSFPGRDEARKRLGLDNSGVVFLAAGHLRRYKGVELLLASWARSGLGNEGAVLILAGSDYLPARARRRLLSSLGPSCRLFDHYLDDDELATLLAASDVAVSPCLRASQSGFLPLAEASGLALLASDAGGLAEQLKGGARQQLFAAGNPAQLSRALQKAAQTAVSGPPGGGWDADRVKKSWQLTVQTLEDELKGLLRRQDPGIAAAGGPGVL
jgi:glycosyltransferase involved in cell wall biosynthesis